MRRHFLLTAFFFLCLTVSAQEQLTNLATIYINTYDGVPITSTEEYLYADFTMVYGTDTLKVDSLRIRGRGNASWNNMNAKKPYRLKFPKKEKLLGKGYANAKNWILLAQADDKSFMRNALTWEMTRFLEMPYSPGYRFVDFYLNGDYRGNYLLCDRIDIRKHRVNIHEQELPVEEDDTLTDISGGYLCEVDGYTDLDKTYFLTTHEVNVRIHSPETDVINKRQAEYIRNVVQQFEDALYSSNPSSYKSLVDSASFMGWYVGGEITANIDAYWSVYFFKEQGDPLLYWGPLWDEDLAYNNTTRLGDVSESLMADVGHGRKFAGKWIDQLKVGQDWFWPDVFNHYKHYYDNGLTDYMTHAIDSLAELLRPSAAKNFEVWDIEEKVFQEIEIYNTFDGYVDALRNFVGIHNDYLLQEFAKRSDIRIPDNTLDTTRYYRMHIYGDTTLVLGIAESKIDGDPATACLRTSDAADNKQQWQVRFGEKGWQFINRETGLCLADYNLSEPYSYALVTYPYAADDTRQQWELAEGVYDDAYNIFNTNTGRIIDNRHSIYTDGNEIISYTTSTGDAKELNRLWIFEPMDSRMEDMQTALRSLSNADYSLRFAPSARRLRFIAPDRNNLQFTVSVYDTTGRLITSFLAADGCTLPDYLPAGTYIASWKNAGAKQNVRFQMK